MDHSNSRTQKALMCLASGVAVLVALAAVASVSARPTWSTFTSFTDARRLRVIEANLYAATSGGLLVVSDPRSPGLERTNIDGLGTNDITDVLKDIDGVLWITGAGRLARIDGSETRQFVTGPILGDRQLLTLADDGDLLWLGSDSGLILFSKVNDDGQYENRFRITTVNQFPPVVDIALDGDSIWCATEVGLAVADRSDPRLIVSPAAWTVYDVAGNPELESSDITRVEIFENYVYVGNPRGLFRLDPGVAPPAFVKDPLVGTRAVNDLLIQDDTLIAVTSNSVARISNGVMTLSAPPDVPGLAITDIRAGGSRWTASSIGGLYYSTGQDFEPYPFVGLPENTVADIGVTPDGVVHALLDTRGLASRIGGEWIEAPEFDVGRRTTKLEIDPRGSVWIGTFYRGAYQLAGNQLSQYSSHNTPLRPDAPVVSGIASDDTRIFISVLIPDNGFSIAIGRLDALDERSAWDSLGALQGLNDPLVISIDVQNNMLAAGTDDNGVYVCNLSTDECVHLTEAVNRLPSEIIRIVRFAPDGALWVGTNFGLVREAIELGLPIFEQVPLPEGVGPDITTMEIDGRGNVWIGMRNGLARYDESTGLIDVYTTENSDLVDDEIRGLALDPVTGDLYIATNFGLSRLTTPTGPPVEEIEEVLAFPNPFVIDSDNDRVRFAFERPARISIFTAAGELVRDLSVNEAWDGRNERGGEVASGVYLFVVIDDDGNKGRGKLLLVRQ